jgi:thioredoxin:protein disulfide reductase
VETYRGTVVVKLPMSGAAAGKPVVLAAESQGCADVGVCYPPTLQKLTLALPAQGTGPGPLVDASPPKKSWFK